MKITLKPTTENRVPTHKLEVIETAFQVLLDHTQDMMFVKNVDLVYIASSRSFARMVGKNSAEEIVGRTDFEILADEQLARRYVADDLKILTGGKDQKNYIEPIPDKDGRPAYGSTSKYRLIRPDGTVLGILGVTRDVTQEYLRRQHYQQELQYLFELPADTYSIVYVDIDDWRIINQRQQLVDGSAMQTCVTVDALLEAALASFVDSGGEAAAFYQQFSPEILRSIYNSGQSFLSLKYLRRMTDGNIRWVQNNVHFLTDPENGHLCVMLSARDIHEEKQKEQELSDAAQLDKMTMLFNRETTMSCIQQVLETDPEQIHVLFMMDIDNFKSLNDTAGHQAGDDFLVSTARELKKCFRESDIVGRIGGDEFFVLMKRVPSFTAAQSKAQILLAGMRKLCRKYPGLQLSASIGISVYPENGRTLSDLYAQADEALYRAKKQGKDQFLFAPVTIEEN